MKLTIILFTVACLHVAITGIAQHVSFSGKNVSLEKLFTVIKQQTGYPVLYSKTKLAGSKPVTVTVTKMPLKEFLDLVFKGQPLEYTIEAQSIIVSPIPVKNDPAKRTVIPPDNNKEDTVPVMLPRKVAELNEVTIIKGYYNTTKRLNTGNVGTIKSADIEKQPVSNPLAAMYGRVPGLVVTQQTGLPGGNFNVQIRGQNSLRNSSDDNGNAPLYLIDGIPYNPGSMHNPFTAQGLYPASGSAAGVSPLNNINPADIESIEILKDADATAIYGSRGANGVVLINTRKGQAGSMQVDLNVRQGVGKITRSMKMLDISQYLEMRKEAYANSNTPVPASAYDLKTWDSTRNINWQKRLLQNNAPYTDLLLSISGGTPQTQYRMSGGFHRESMVIPGDFGDWRGSGQFSLNNTSIDKRFRSQASISYSRGKSNMITSDLTANALTLAPNTPELIDAHGELLFPQGITISPLAYMVCDYDANTSNLLGSTSLSYEILPGLQAKINAGYTYVTRNETGREPNKVYPESLRPLVASRAWFGNAGVESWSIEPQINWQKTFGLHRLTALTGASFQSEISKSTRQSAFGFTSEALMGIISAYPPANVTNTYNEEHYRYNAIFGRIEYAYDGKYVVNISGRRDGSSRFGPGKQFANFGAIGAAWVFSDESFFPTNSFLSFGKLRGSYGSAGSDQTKNYGFLDLYEPSGTYQGVPGLAPIQLYNSNFAWERNRKLEFGLELGALQNKLLFNLSWYYNRSSNQLVGYPLPPSSGFPSVPKNMDAIVQNTGLEFELSYSTAFSNKLYWNSSFNLTIPRNKLISYPNLEGSSYAQTYVVGYPLTIRKLYNYLGVNPTTGLYQVEDVNHDNLYNSNDQVIIKNIGQQWYAGFSNTLKWKNFELDMLWQYIRQQGTNYLAALSGRAPGSAAANQPVEVMKRWRQEGDITNIQKFTLQNSDEYRAFANSSASVSDASFARLRNLALHYHLPTSFIKKAKLKGLTLGVEAQNLVTITRYRGLDPEVQGMRQPPLRVITGMLRLTF